MDSQRLLREITSNCIIQLCFPELFHSLYDGKQSKLKLQYIEMNHIGQRPPYLIIKMTFIYKFDMYLFLLSFLYPLRVRRCHWWP